jgi:hypothetical protein
MDKWVARIKLYAGTIVVVGALVAGLSAVMVSSITAKVSAEQQQTRETLQSFIKTQRDIAGRDSVRFERVMAVVELAVVAIVEPIGSDEQVGAVAELRRRRHVTPLTEDR